MNDTPYQRMLSYQDDFTKTEFQIHKYISENMHFVATSSIENVAAVVGTSKSALVRFAKKIGYSGYAEFRFELSRYLVANNCKETNSHKGTSIEVISFLYISCIQKISDYITMEDTRRIAERIQRARRIKIAGTNRSFQAARQLKQRLGRIGYDSEALEDRVDLADAADLCGSDDLFIIFTISGKGRYDNIATALHERNCQLICITMSQVLSFRSYCTETVVLPRIDRESDTRFFDNQAIFFVYIEILLNVLVSENTE